MAGCADCRQVLYDADEVCAKNSRKHDCDTVVVSAYRRWNFIIYAEQRSGGCRGLWYFCYSVYWYGILDVLQQKMDLPRRKTSFKTRKNGTGQDWPPGDFLRPVGNQPLYGFGTVEPDLSHDLQGGGEQKRSVYFYERSVFFEYSGLGISDREGKAGGPELLKSARNLRVAEKYIVDISWI